MEVPEHLKRTVFDSSRLEEYYDRISLPLRHRHVRGAPSTKFNGANSSEALSFLSTLQRYHLSAIPFENVSLHYSPHHTISLDPYALHHKIVAQNAGRGGYCMENNGLFCTVLQSLGFDVYPVGARINSALNGSTQNLAYGGW